MVVDVTARPANARIATSSHCVRALNSGQDFNVESCLSDQASLGLENDVYIDMAPVMSESDIQGGFSNARMESIP